LTDGQLLERFATRDGDPAELAFAALVERHGPMVFRVARAALGDEHSAHDAFQATFLILARKAQSLWVRDSLGPWLHAVAFRVANHSRTLEARRSRHERAASRPEAYDSRDWARDDLARAIHEEIERLPEPYRAAVVTCHLEGLTQQDAARRLGWPVGTLQSRLARGRQRLRDRLKRRGLAPSLGGLAVKLSPVPNALVASTAKAATTLHLGGAIAGMIAPAVLAMIHSTTKGMLMTKLKLGALALMMVGGLVGSGMGLGVGRNLKATEGPADHVVQSKPAEVGVVPPAAVLEPVPGKWRAKDGIPPLRVEADLPALVDPISDIRPPGFPTLLYFHADWAAPCRQSRIEIDRLTRQRYPIMSVDIDGRSELVDRHRVTAVPAYILVDEAGRELGRIEGTMPASKLAEFYNDTWKKSRKPDQSEEGSIITAEPPTRTLPKTGEKPVSTDSVPRPVETDVFPILLYFQDSHAARQHLPNEIQWLIRLGYPIKMIDYDESPELVKRYGIFTLVTIVLVDGQGSPIAELKGDLRAREIARFYNLNCLKSSATFRRGDGSGKAVSEGSARVEEPILIPSREPIPHRAVSPDQDHRVDDLERKLDQVLKALEDLKGDRLWDRRDDSPNLKGR
jgi:RNA polymerase sigma factor (sigma-70 family)